MSCFQFPLLRASVLLAFGVSALGCMQNRDDRRAVTLASSRDNPAPGPRLPSKLGNPQDSPMNGLLERIRAREAFHRMTPEQHLLAAREALAQQHPDEALRHLDAIPDNAALGADLERLRALARTEQADGSATRATP